MAAKQFAALPIRWTKKNNLRVLLVTSRDTGRWVMPKGWPMDGKKPWRAAAIEAMEEAGVMGVISEEEIGTYEYHKGLGDGTKVKCNVSLYPLMVDRTLKNWPERNERRRKWFSAEKAAKAVKEPQLRAILKDLRKKPHKQPVIRELLEAS